MSEKLHFITTTMLSSRKADYYLCCLDASVFIDFNLSDQNTIYLVRISFDGFGCCNLSGNISHLSMTDSELFINQMKKETLNQMIITKLVKKLIKANLDLIWRDALERYNLID